MGQLLQSIQSIEIPQSLSKRAVLRPDDVIGQHIEIDEVISAWDDLLACLEMHFIEDDMRIQIATWKSEESPKDASHVSLKLIDDQSGESLDFEVPLVWDENSWFVQLERLGLWDIDDLRGIARVHFRSNPSFAQLPGVLDEPMKLAMLPAFRRALDRSSTGDRRLQRGFIDALTKLLYRVPDPELGDETIRSRQGERRFRISYPGRTVRAHYIIKQGEITLTSFSAEHRADRIG
ncbi:MAG: hypothetical protein JW941_07750 [Candidatus Coatesbacteria bacterium]|nr:hypothetical protein [Candidatus Coatesbacteria bacterium]